MTDEKPRLNQMTIIRDGRDYEEYQPGEVGHVKDNVWMVCCPLCSNLGTLSTHQITENEDQTITVSPSLVCHGSIYEAPHAYRPCTAHYFIDHNQIRWC